MDIVLMMSVSVLVLAIWLLTFLDLVNKSWTQPEATLKLTNVLV